MKMDNTKKTCIYQNKTSLMLDKKKSTLINNKNISNYASKPNQYNYADSLIKHRINAKKNNSICFINNYEKNKESFIDSKYNINGINGTISNKNKEINTSSIILL